MALSLFVLVEKEETTVAPVEDAEDKEDDDNVGVDLAFALGLDSSM